LTNPFVEALERAEQLLAERAAEIERLLADLVEAEKYNGYHQEACLEIERLRAALDNIVIGGIGERNFTLSEIRAYAADALERP